MAHRHSWGYRAICWIMLVVFYIQSLNPALLGYTRSSGGGDAADADGNHHRRNLGTTL